MRNKGDLLTVVNSVAPIRVCDNGGWTDTWFAEYGSIFNIAVCPYVEVQMFVFENRGGKERITINAENYGEKYTISEPNGLYDKHPLLEAAFDYMHIPRDVAIEVSIYSEAPSGCSTGTSAAVSVALIGALDLLTPGRLVPHEVSQVAHKIETELLGQQCGIQDQIASAYGGINYIEMHKYPHASVSQIIVPEAVWWELESRLLLIYLGQAHSSSEVHQQVIKELTGTGSDCQKLNALRDAARESRDALYDGDLPRLGKAMIKNTDAQATLHPSLVSPRHQIVIDAARSHGAIGWKVNGAGGNGGSVTVLCAADRTSKRTLVKAVHDTCPELTNIPIQLSHFGLRVWKSEAAASRN